MSKLPRVLSAADAVARIGSGESIYISSSGSVPRILIKALCARGRTGLLHNVFLRHIHTGRTEDYAAPDFEGIFHSESFFVGDNMRRQVQRGAADYIPASFYEAQQMIRTGVVGCDTAFIQVSPPGRHGKVSLGISVDIGPAAIDAAKSVIAVMNPNMPYTYGDGEIELSRIDCLVEDDSPLDETVFPLPNEIERSIGRHCAELIEDGSCLQLGIGAVPNAVLSQLSDRKDLGIHTEMFADGLLPLVEAGVVNGARKKIDRGKIVASFLMGSRRVFQFANRNRMLRMREVAYTNDPFRIARNPKVVAINSAIQVDLTGQVCADSVGTKIYSGVGGQPDFVYGALRSEGGKPIIAMPSRTTAGISKIVPVLDAGAGVVTLRNCAHYIVTEYGSVDLYGKPLQERAKLLIRIAHPDCREALEKAAFERFGKHFLH